MKDGRLERSDSSKPPTNMTNNPFRARFAPRPARSSQLRLSGNSITGLTLDDLKSLSNLRILNLDHNLIRSLPDDIPSMPHLIILSLRNNKIKTLPYTSEFKNLPSLECLSLSSNSLSALDVLGLLSTCPSLTKIYANKNEIASKFSSSPDSQNGNILTGVGSILNERSSADFLLNLSNNPLTASAIPCVPADLISFFGQVRNQRGRLAGRRALQ